MKMFICKVLCFVILFVGILIPIRYESINVRYISFRLIHSILTLKHSFEQDENRPMLSAEYRAFESLLRVKSESDLIGDPLTVVAKMRSSFGMSHLLPRPSGCYVRKQIFTDDDNNNKHSVDTYWINMNEKQSDMLLIYYHGGGYMVGNIDSHLGFQCYLSNLFQMNVIHVEYRLTPENPLPLAVDDTVVVYRQLLKESNVLPSKMFVMGDSAGGGLVLLTIQSLLKNKIDMPRGVIVLSPWTDLTLSGQSYIRNNDKEILVKRKTAQWISSYVLGVNRSELSLNNPLVSPLWGSFEGFPSMYINVGTAEILEDDSRQLYQKAKEANVDVTFEEGVHLCHCYPVFYLFYPEAQQTLDNIRKWIVDKH